jgi:hypothetical protein
LHDVESLLIAVSKPEGNKNRGRLKGDLKKDLKRFLKTAADEEISASVYPNQKRMQRGSRRITDKATKTFIDSVGLKRTAARLGVTGGRVWQLKRDNRLRQWVIAAGKREELLVAIDAARP